MAKCTESVEGAFRPSQERGLRCSAYPSPARTQPMCMKIVDATGTLWPCSLQILHPAPTPPAPPAPLFHLPLPATCNLIWEDKESPLPSAIGLLPGYLNPKDQFLRLRMKQVLPQGRWRPGHGLTGQPSPPRVFTVCAQPASRPQSTTV